MMKYLLIGLIILSANNCSQDDNKQNTKKINFVENTQAENKENKLNNLWVLEKMANKNATDFFKNEVPNLEINISENKIMGFSGCNYYFADFITLKEDSFVLKPIAATKKYCIDVPEQAYFKLLQEADSYQLKDTSLILLKDKQELLRFKQN
ncbi:MAG: META domain-containing protein [Bacteroidetes bacterium]|nr:META domain-containing protein [Bacteroidota bacterium]MCB9226953.1 META domain-containing protein [Chitinophagales bacterium]